MYLRSFAPWWESWISPWPVQSVVSVDFGGLVCPHLLSLSSATYLVIVRWDRLGRGDVSIWTTLLADRHMVNLFDVVGGHWAVCQIQLVESDLIRCRIPMETVPVGICLSTQAALTKWNLRLNPLLSKSITIWLFLLIGWGSTIDYDWWSDVALSRSNTVIVY